MSASAPVIVLLAAGEGRRFGSAKQLAEVGGQAMLRRAVETAQATGLAVIVVTGAHAEAVEPLLADLPVQRLHHAQWREGMGSSLAAGMCHLRRHHPQASAVLVCLADQPLIDITILRAVLAEHGRVPERIVAVRHGDTAGPPALFPRQYFDVLAASSGDRGARALLAAEADRVSMIERANALDIDTPADLDRARRAWLAQQR
ncbi:nucleotidyltransferase family protein [Dyella sp.]|jgi:CTP:molybdopterin cytidylyltransferase MocA|uniref:nucleotidyltransferase family protein n=1 Tax=Dyella sp. TaxID=1869338 RepID=UPI002D79617D|nr:nucleotidyltransferase family protein [Dyella sp.]HET6432808.1 nucleotidyltransferase family protein [Dyella sp.]